jgi:hypothetical protein
MGKISTYTEVVTPSLSDLLIGTDVDSDNATKNFSISDVLSLATTPTLDDVLASGNTSTRNIDLTGSAAITAPAVTSPIISSTSQLYILGSLTDSNSSVGTSGQVLKSTGTNVEWASLDESSSMELVLDASTTVAQSPTQLDTPIVLTFGSAQGTPSDPVSIDAVGNITFNENGVYFVKSFFNAVNTSGGVSHLMFRGLIGSSEISEQKVLFIDSQNIYIPYEETVPVIIESAPTVLKFEMMRDSANSGDNLGGLRSYAGSGTFSSVPSKSVKIWKQTISL